MLAGGSGGAKLAEGMQQILGEGLSVIANTADDVEILGADVSPDPDLVTYWLCGQIDEAKGYGLKGDTTDRLRPHGRRSARPTGSTSPTATSRPASTAAPSSTRAAPAPAPRPRSPGPWASGRRCCR